MTDERYHLLNATCLPLTDLEIQEGWHYCHEFDELLVGPDMHELNFCKCLDPYHKVYQTKPPITP